MREFLFQMIHTIQSGASKMCRYTLKTKATYRAPLPLQKFAGWGYVFCHKVVSLTSLTCFGILTKKYFSACNVSLCPWSFMKV